MTMIDDCQKRWPNLVFLKESEGQYFAQEGKDRPGHGLWFRELTERTVESLNRFDNNVRKEKILTARWPWLWFSVDDVKVHVWIVRWYEHNRRDGASTGFSFTMLGDYPDSESTAELDRLNHEGAIVQDTENWFFCSRCKIAKPRTEYAYFYFAGEYCKKCQKDRPEHYRAAMTEDYN